ncbi:MAG: YraN family protein [Spirochaetia bacterium]
MDRCENSGDYRPRNTKKVGFWGESLACDYLIQRGQKIIERNFKSPYGEVDIVVEHERVLIFVEVKTWQTYGISDLEYSISAVKRRRIIQTSLYFLEKNMGYEDHSLRYDVCLLTGTSGVYYIENAFEGDGTPI